MRLEQIFNPERRFFEIAEAIKFYESQLSPEALEECKQAEGTEGYVDLLFQKYKEMFKDKRR